MQADKQASKWFLKSLNLDNRNVLQTYNNYILENSIIDKAMGS
jgi:hypothetical protein